MSTVHIKAEKGDFAKTVLMPGDPQRSRFIAENYLSDARLVNNLRGVCGYTGYYKGKRVSVMASGMGQPSMGIYSYELYSFFDVENIIRIGTCGCYPERIKPGDLIIAVGASSDSAFAARYDLPGTLSAVADFGLARDAYDYCVSGGIRFEVGSVLSSDIFYDDNGHAEKWAKMGLLGVEMESYALYCTAASLGKKALAICTVSDALYDSSLILSPEERETGLKTMIEAALEIAR